jgi:hypothetical protein
MKRRIILSSALVYDFLANIDATLFVNPKQPQKNDGYGREKDEWDKDDNPRDNTETPHT